MISATAFGALLGLLQALHTDNPTGAVEATSATASPFAHRTELVTNRVHLIYRPDVDRIPAEGNVEVIEQEDGLVVVDAGGAVASGEDVVAQIKRISKLPVKFLIYTHWHGDHNLGSSAFVAAYPGISIISTIATRSHLMDGSQHLDRFVAFHKANADQFLSSLKHDHLDQEMATRLIQAVRDTPTLLESDKNLHPALPTITFTEALTIADDIAPVEVVFLGRANTDGDALAWLPKQKVLITGDVVVSPVPYGSESYPKEWLDVLNRVNRYPFSYLIPGHGAVERDHVYVTRMIALLNEMRDRIDPLAKGGLSLAQVQKQVDFKDQFKIVAGQSSWRHEEFDGYFVLPMISNVYLEATGKPIRQGQPF